MKTIYRFSLVQTIMLCLTFLGNTISAQTPNLAPPGILANQSKTNPPPFLSFTRNSADNNSQPITNTIATIVNQTTWDGKTWSNGFPDAQTKAIISGNLETSDIIEANAIEINEGVAFTLQTGGMLKLQQPISEVTKSKINLSGGSGLLVKSIDSRNPNTLIITRYNVNVNQYTGLYLSSPVSGQTIGGTNPSSAYSQSKYDNTGYVAIPASEVMLPGIGYTETGDGNGNYTQGNIPSQGGYDHQQAYNGTENTSDYTVSLNGAGGYNLVGNPYASYLDSDSFLQDTSNTNAGTIYLWTHNTLADTSGNGGGVFRFTSNDFAVYNLLGGVNAGYAISAGLPNNTNNQNIPDGKIAFGTGFFLLGSGTATFKTNMTTPFGSQIFRTSSHNRVSSPTALIAPPSRSRIWLNLADSSGSYRQTLVGYATGATSAGTDLRFDSPVIDQTSVQPRIDLYSLATGSTTKLAIQGKSLAAFLPTDSFQLGYKASSSGTYTFTSTSDGIFSSQPYYILDANDGQYHTLPYTFSTAAGTFNTRFKVVFENLIGFVFPTNICGSQLTNINNSVYAYNLTGTTNYHFQVSNDSAFNSIFGEFSGAYPTYPYVFNLNLSGITFNTTYWVRVATYQLNGIWQYGPICQITTPTNPPTSYLSSNSCNTTISSYWATIFAQQISAVGITATQYRFNVTVGSNTYTYTAPVTNPVSSRCNLYNFSGMPLTPNTVYSFTVDVLWNGVWQIGTTVCTITSPNVLPRFSDAAISIFEAKAYPNPFANNFKIELNTSSEENISLKAYDMLGRIVEARETSITDFDSQEIGSTFTSGVYNIIITQGENVKSMRVVKR